MPRTEAEQPFWEAAFLEAFRQCLREHGLQGAIGCAHLCREAADAALTERRISEQQP